MKAEYDFSKATKNPFAKRMKEGYSVAIHYGTQDVENIDAGTAVNPEDIDMERLQGILERPGLKSLHLYFHEKTNKFIG